MKRNRMRNRKRQNAWVDNHPSHPTSLYFHLCHVCHTLNESSFEIHECVKCQAVFTLDATAAIMRTSGMNQEWDEDFSEGLPRGFSEYVEEMEVEEEIRRDFHHDPLPFGRKKTSPLTGLKVQW